MLLVVIFVELFTRGAVGGAFGGALGADLEAVFESSFAIALFKQKQTVSVNLMQMTRLHVGLEENEKHARDDRSDEHSSEAK